jgi:hypothetical protein
LRKPGRLIMAVGEDDGKGRGSAAINKEIGRI